MVEKKIYIASSDHMVDSIRDVYEEFEKINEINIHPTEPVGEVKHYMIKVLGRMRGKEDGRNNKTDKSTEAEA